MLPAGSVPDHKHGWYGIECGLAEEAEECKRLLCQYADRVDMHPHYFLVFYVPDVEKRREFLRLVEGNCTWSGDEYWWRVLVWKEKENAACPQKD